MKSFLYLCVVSSLLLAGFSTADDSSFRDARDGKTYKTITIAGKTWMAQNLNYEATGSSCYSTSALNCEHNGRLYDWNAAQKSCPEGWRLPSKQEWEQLVNSYPSSEDAYKALVKEGTTGFNATLHGVLVVEDNQYLYLNDHGAYWTSTNSDDSRAWVQRFLANTKETYQSQAIKINGHACRCVKN